MFHLCETSTINLSDKNRSGSGLNKNPKWIGRSWGDLQVNDRLGRVMKNTRCSGWKPANKEDCATILEEVGTHPNALEQASNSGVHSSLRSTDFSHMTMGEFSEFVTSGIQTRSSTRNTEIFAIHESNSSNTTIVIASSNTSRILFDEESSDDEDDSPREEKRRKKDS